MDKMGPSASVGRSSRLEDTGYPDVVRSFRYMPYLVSAFDGKIGNRYRMPQSFLRCLAYRTLLSYVAFYAHQRQADIIAPLEAVCPNYLF